VSEPPRRAQLDRFIVEIHGLSGRTVESQSVEDADAEDGELSPIDLGRGTEVDAARRARQKIRGALPELVPPKRALASQDDLASRIRRIDASEPDTERARAAAEWP
jgi:hypothetical protein